jgi:hypothetical protein
MYFWSTVFPVAISHRLSMWALALTACYRWTVFPEKFLVCVKKKAEFFSHVVPAAV